MFDIQLDTRVSSANINHGKHTWIYWRRWKAEPELGLLIGEGEPARHYGEWRKVSNAEGFG